MVGTNHPLPETGSSLGRFWAVVLSSEEGLPPAAPHPHPSPRGVCTDTNLSSHQLCSESKQFLGVGRGERTRSRSTHTLGICGWIQEWSINPLV